MDDKDYVYDPLLDEDEPEEPRRRVRPAVVVGIIVVLLIVLAGGFFAVRPLILARISPTPLPLPTIAPGDNLFYVDTNPTWGSVSVDGHALVHLPVMGQDQPIQLSAGVHEIVWHADPFTPQTCYVFVPPQATSNSCVTSDLVGVPAKGSSKTPTLSTLKAHVLSFTVSLISLANAQRNALTNAAQAALDKLSSTDMVQPGEKYADVQAANFVATANEPLSAVLRFQLDTNPNSPAPCNSFNIGFNTNGECRVNGQDCLLFCTSEVGPTLGAVYKTWDVYAVIRATWNYTALDGRVVASNQPDETDNTGTEYAVPLSIAWQNGSWQVRVQANDLSNFFTPVTTNQFTPTSNPACVVAASQVNNNFLVFGQSVGVVNNINWQFTSGANTAAGCLAKAVPQPLNQFTPVPTNGPTAYCLFRFGVALAVNDLAHRYYPSLPLANAYEQNLARQLAQQHGS